MSSTKKALFGLFVLLSAYLYREYQDASAGGTNTIGRVPPFRRFVNLWEQKTTHVAMIVCMFLFAFFVLSLIIKGVFDDIREIERMVGLSELTAGTGRVYQVQVY